MTTALTDNNQGLDLANRIVALGFAAKVYDPDFPTMRCFVQPSTGVQATIHEGDHLQLWHIHCGVFSLDAKRLPDYTVTAMIALYMLAVEAQS